MWSWRSIDISLPLKDEIYKNIIVKGSMQKRIPFIKILLQKIEVSRENLHTSAD